MLKDVTLLPTDKFNKGLVTRANIFTLEAGQSPSCLNVVFGIDGLVEKRLGSSTMNTTVLQSTGGYGMYDFGVPEISSALLMHMDGKVGSSNFIDSSINNYTITASGGAHMQATVAKWGTNGVYFDGTTSQLTIPDSTDWDFMQTATDSWTIDFWAKHNNYDKNQYYVVQQESTTDRWMIGYSSANGISLGVQKAGVTTIVTSVNDPITDHNWHHITLVKKASNYGIYLDGIQIAYVTSKSVDTLAAELTIGTRANASWFDGHLDSLRISKSNVFNASPASDTSDTITIPTAAATTDANTKLLLNFEDNFDDESASGHTVTNSAAILGREKFGTASLYLAGSVDFLEIADSDDWTFNSGDFTIDTQVNLNDLPDAGSTPAIVSHYASTANSWRMSLEEDTGVYYLAFRQTDSTITFGIAQSAVINTATWYHFAVVRSSNNWLFFQNGTQLGVTSAATVDLGNISAPLRIGTYSPKHNWLSGFIDELRVTKGIARWATNFTPSTNAYTNSPVGFEARLLCASGTGIFYSTDLGKTWTEAHTSRTATLNHFALVKGWMINCNDEYETPLYWAGSIGTSFEDIATDSAPTCRYPASHQGFAFLLNEKGNRRSVYYVDENEMFTTASWSNFALPVDRNDELTGGFELNNNFYVSSKFRLFRLGYVGGNPDWTYKEVRSWGFVPETFKKVSMPGVGQVVIGLDWDKNIRAYNGREDEIISTDFENDNGMTDFYLKNLSDENLEACWAENDRKAQVYRLHVVYGDSNTVSYSINFDYRTGSWYPWSNQPFQSGVLAQDTIGGLHMLACNYNGHIHHLNSGNQDVATPIDDHYDSIFYYRETPAKVTKSQKMSLFFKTTSSGTIHYQDRTDFSSIWNLSKTFDLTSSISAVHTSQTIDIPKVNNVYQFRVSSSSNTADPWKLTRADYFQEDIGIGRR